MLVPVDTRQEVKEKNYAFPIICGGEKSIVPVSFILQLFLLGSIRFGLVDQVDDDKCRYWCLRLSWQVELASAILENHYQASDHIHHELT